MRPEAKPGGGARGEPETGLVHGASRDHLHFYLISSTDEMFSTIPNEIHDSSNYTNLSLGMKYRQICLTCTLCKVSQHFGDDPGLRP